MQRLQRVQDRRKQEKTLKGVKQQRQRLSDPKLGDLSFAQRKEEKMGNVGNTTGSMLYGFGAFLVIYLAGVLIYQVVLWIQKWKRKKKDGEQENG